MDYRFGDDDKFMIVENCQIFGILFASYSCSEQNSSAGGAKNTNSCVGELSYFVSMVRRKGVFSLGTV